MATVTQRLSTVILTQEKLTNVFVIRDEAYGHIYDKETGLQY